MDNTTSASIDNATLDRAVKKAAWRFIPLLCLAYFFNYLDRTSVGYAALQMTDAIGLTAAQFGLGAGIMFLGYCLCEVPSNLLMFRFGARVWLARIMISWGLVAALTAFVFDPYSFYVIRLLLGIAEAGFFPGVIFFLTLWFPVQYRTHILALFTIATPISFLIGGPLSTWLLTFDGLGLQGWQWMFIIEGLPACFLAFFTYKYLTNTPQEADWLTTDEKNAIIQSLANEKKKGAVSHNFVQSLKDVRVWILGSITFSFTLGTYGIGIWLPQMLKSHGIEVSMIGWVSAIPYFFSTVGLIFWAKYVDKTGKAIGNLMIALILGGVALLVAVSVTGLVPALIGITLALVCTISAKTIFYTLPAKFLTGEAAAGSIALINSIGAFGGFVGPYMMGYLKTATNSFNTGFMMMGCILFFAALMAWVLTRFMPKNG